MNVRSISKLANPFDIYYPWYFQKRWQTIFAAPLFVIAVGFMVGLVIRAFTDAWAHEGYGFTSGFFPPISIALSLRIFPRHKFWGLVMLFVITPVLSLAVVREFWY